MESTTDERPIADSPMSRRCPACGLWNTEHASRCDCGFDFSTRRRSGDWQSAVSLTTRLLLFAVPMIVAMGSIIVPLGSPIPWDIIFLFPIGLGDALGMFRDNLDARYNAATFGWAIYVWLGWALLGCKRRSTMILLASLLCLVLVVNVLGLSDLRPSPEDQLREPSPAAREP